MSANNVALLAFAAECRSAAACCCQSISPAHWAHSSKPTPAACSGRQTGRQCTVTQSLPHTMQAVSTIRAVLNMGLALFSQI